MTDMRLTAEDRAGIVLHGPGSEDETALHSRIKGAIEDAEREAVEWCCGWVPRDRAEDLRRRWQEVRGG